MPDVFGRKEGIKDFFQVRLADSWAGVGKGDFDHIFLWTITSADIQISAALHGFGGIDNHIDENAFNLGRVNHGERQIALEMFDDLNIVK